MLCTVRGRNDFAAVPLVCGLGALMRALHVVPVALLPGCPFLCDGADYLRQAPRARGAVIRRLTARDKKQSRSNYI